ncbi:MAG: hypothetical protein QW074_07800 [Candidatus Caldarchaeum sp.]
MRESLAVLIVVGASALYSFLLTALLLTAMPTTWLNDAVGVTLLWLWLAASVPLHELAHRTVMRIQGIQAEIAVTRGILGFGGDVKVPEGATFSAAGAASGPIVTMVMAAIALAASPVFKHLSLAALALSATLIGTPFGLDGRYMGRRMRMIFLITGLALTVASVYAVAHLAKYAA